MTERQPPVWQQAGAYSAADDRLVTGLLTDRATNVAGDNLGIDGGVVPPLDQMRVTAPGNTMSFSISAGTVIVPAAGVTPPGAYICFNDGAAGGTLDIEASANPRLDLIVADVDDQASGDSVSSWSFKVIKGSPNPNPVAPAWGANQIPIASIRVIPASQNGGVNKITNAGIYDMRRFVAGIGGTHLTWEGVPNPAHSPGRSVYNVSNGTLYVDDGTTLQTYYSFTQLSQYFAAYRPKTAVTGKTLLVKPNKDWIASPILNGTTSASDPTLVTAASPSGSFKIHMVANGKVSNSGVSGIMSVQVLNGSTSVFMPDGLTYGIAYYNTSWSRSGGTFLLTGLPTNTDLKFRLTYYKNSTTTAHVFSVATPVLTVEPVI